MADNNRNYGYRSNDSLARNSYPASAPQAPADPLAELARLIGQQNESSASYRPNGATGAVGYGQDYSNDRRNASSQSGYGQPDGYGSGFSDTADHSQYGDPYRQDPRYVDPYAAAPQPYADPGQAYGSHRSSYSEQQYVSPQAESQRYGDSRYVDPNFDASAQGYSGYSEPQAYPGSEVYPGSQGYAGSQGYPDARYGTGAPDSQGYRGPSDAYSAYGNDAYRGAAGASHSSYFGSAPADMHRPMPEDHAPARRRGSIVTVLAVLALAVVGTASAFGYRAMFGTAGTPVPPPVIKADPRPSKVVPVAGDPNAKPIQDRVGPDGERVVSREEAPRVVFPNLADQGAKSGPAVAANVGPTGSAGPAEPKKIRTVAIKPESASARNAQASADNAPLALSPGAPPAAAPAAPNRQQHQQQASRAATSGSASPFPAPIASANPVAGGYAVQVTSQRSESDAMASYKSLQSQFPTVLGSRQPVIKRADLGDKGTYYRAQIPFSSQSEASDFCSSLKTAGGQCVVQKN